ncbi:MAG: hypothetical protein H6708_23060 [Kofleriaceae bacterium]|nr:hypothetical protein [Myxococcales bacterium]MCB9563289.1 hypothetical protein [Kofleriaceae bacterium]
MGGCTNCTSKSGCDDRKGSMLGAVDQALARLYPTATWGEPDDDARAGVGEDEGAALAEELAAELDAAAFFRPGADDDGCDWIYVLCLGRPPCIVQVRDHGVAPPAEWAATAAAGGRIEERYLRVCLSSLARVAAVQEVAIDATPLAGDADAGGAGPGWMIRERPRAGVYDAPLLRRMQRLVAILPAYDLLHLDFGEITAAPAGFAPGAWPALYGGDAPCTANYLFYPQPTTTVVTQLIGTEA